MGWFKRKKTVEAVPQTDDHAVIAHFALSNDEFGAVEEREAIFELEDRLEALIEEHGVGEFDGNEFGGGEVTLYCYGPDADRLFGAIEAELRAHPARPAYVRLQYGDPGNPNMQERRVDL